jgi:hypothetical protein
MKREMPLIAVSAMLLAGCSTRPAARPSANTGAFGDPKPRRDHRVEVPFTMAN